MYINIGGGFFMKRKILLLMMCFIVFTTSACGASKKSDSSMESKNDNITLAGNASSLGFTGKDNVTSTMEELKETNTIDSVNPTKTSGEKLIVTMNLGIETLEFDKFIELLERKTIEGGGYIESSSSENNSYRSERLKYATYTLRIPNNVIDDFVAIIGDSANIINKTTNTENVTLAYYDSESRKKALEIQQERLLKLLEKADKIEDIIELESRLSEVTYQLESQNSILRNYDNLVAYSTIHVSVYEVERETKVEKESTTQKMISGLSDTLYEIKQGIESFAVFLVSNLPYLVFWGVVIAVGIITGRRIRRKKRKNHTINEMNSSKESENKSE